MDMARPAMQGVATAKSSPPSSATSEVGPRTAGKHGVLMETLNRVDGPLREYMELCRVALESWCHNDPLKHRHATDFSNDIQCCVRPILAALANSSTAISRRHGEHLEALVRRIMLQCGSDMLERYELDMKMTQTATTAPLSKPVHHPVRVPPAGPSVSPAHIAPAVSLAAPSQVPPDSQGSPPQVSPSPQGLPSKPPPKQRAPRGPKVPDNKSVAKPVAPEQPTRAPVPQQPTRAPVPQQPTRAPAPQDRSMRAPKPVAIPVPVVQMPVPGVSPSKGPPAEVLEAARIVANDNVPRKPPKKEDLPDFVVEADRPHVYSGKGERVKRLNKDYRRQIGQLYSTYVAADNKYKREIARTLFVQIAGKGGIFWHSDGTQMKEREAVSKIMRALKDYRRRGSKLVLADAKHRAGDGDDDDDSTSTEEDSGDEVNATATTEEASVKTDGGKKLHAADALLLMMGAKDVDREEEKNKSPVSTERKEEPSSADSSSRLSYRRCLPTANSTRPLPGLYRKPGDGSPRPWSAWSHASPTASSPRPVVTKSPGRSGPKGSKAGTT